MSKSRETTQKADPIFAAIETHRAAHVAHAAACQKWGVVNSTDPAFKSAQANTIKAMRAADRAATALTNIVPTTYAGTIALLQYVDDFNRGAIPKGEHHLWPADLEDAKIKTRSGKVLAMPYPYWIMRNVHTALARLLGQ